MAWGGVIFTMLMMAGRDFYYGNRFWGEVWISFSMLELAGFGQSVTYILTSHPRKRTYKLSVKCKQASNQR